MPQTDPDMLSIPLPILAGQRLMAGFEGTEFNDDLRHLIGTLRVGGLILFSRNIRTPEQLNRLCSSIQDYARTLRLPPLLIAIDQEGGTVARLTPPFTQFPGAAQMRTPEAVRHFARITADELCAVGVNMNMAPVLDVVPPNADSVMADRSYGSDPWQVSDLGCRVIEHLQQHNIMAVAKHFPGIGRTVLDSHLDLPALGIDTDALHRSDLVPFRSAVERNVAGIMLSHIIYPAIDPIWPASLSPSIARDLLRIELGFQGLVITDDLDMGAIKKHYDIRTAIGQILAADIDLALICHKGPDIDAAHAEITRVLQSNEDLRDRGAAAVDRLLGAKRRYLGRWD
jgi:beta-N-acetylhexosaminidase